MLLQVTLRRFFEFAAFLSETFVFAYLGLQVRLPAHCVPYHLAALLYTCSTCRASVLSFLESRCPFYSPVPPSLPSQRYLWQHALLLLQTCSVC